MGVFFSPRCLLFIDIHVNRYWWLFLAKQLVCIRVSSPLIKHLIDDKQLLIRKEKMGCP